MLLLDVDWKAVDELLLLVDELDVLWNAVDSLDELLVDEDDVDWNAVLDELELLLELSSAAASPHASPTTMSLVLIAAV